MKSYRIEKNILTMTHFQFPRTLEGYTWTKVEQKLDMEIFRSGQIDDITGSVYFLRIKM